MIERIVLEADESAGMWRYRVKYGEEWFFQQVWRHPDTDRLDSSVAHLSYIPEDNGEWHEVLEALRSLGPPYFTSIDEAVADADRLILAWRSEA
ncbi:MAG: hypothetical protein AB7P40_02550 [Chloroflexota bacterium]